MSNIVTYYHRMLWMRGSLACSCIQMHYNSQSLTPPGVVTAGLLAFKAKVMA
jgi:hypothetical protein